tara:strand:- start:14861 stop:15664 length:804 start_codon:yes stop_codon:yes gene_type:complete
MIPSDLKKYKEEGKKIMILTAWDSISASIVEEAGADIVLVGDSLAMVALGHATTLPVTLDEMIKHTQAVERGFLLQSKKKPLLICDLPFLSYQCGEDKAVEAAGRLLKNSSASGVKVEGAEPEIIKVIGRLIRMGIPVMGHLGLLPQSVNNTGYKQQGLKSFDQEKILSQAKLLESSGCFAIIVEHIPNDLTKKIIDSIKIPIIGIGAGSNCDGQVRVTADLLGLSTKQPPFSPSLIEGRKIFIQALNSWMAEQRSLAKIPTKQTFQ